MKTNAFTLLFCIILAISLTACSTQDHPQASITKTEHTIITPHLGAQIDSNNNLIYCSSFQMAWNKLRDDVIKGDILLESDPSSARQLNKKLQSNDDIAKKSYVAEAGELSPELLTRINNELHEKFGDQAGNGVKIPLESGAHQLIAYAFLYKNLEFRTVFEKLPVPMSFSSNGRTTPVKAFGINLLSHSNRLHEELSPQVEILDYQNDDNFILSLKPKSADNEIILAKITPEKTLLQTLKIVAQRIAKSKPDRLWENEVLRIPKIDFELGHRFSELENKRVKNKAWDGWIMATALQDIKFKLDEKGAVLKSRAFIGMTKGEAPAGSKHVPRHFIFDKPFLICLQERTGRFPYFAMWVNNSELLLK